MWNTLFPHPWESPQSSPTPTARINATISQWPRFWTPEFGNTPSCTSHSQETWDENRFKNAQKTIGALHLTFKPGTEFTLKNKQPHKWDLKWRAQYRIVHIECDRHYLHIENQTTGKTQSCNVNDVVHKPPVELWNIDTQFGRAGKFINHPSNLPSPYKILSKKVYICTCSLTYNATFSQSISHRNAAGAKQDKPEWESILFQLVLKAYARWHTRIITAHISLGNLNKQLHMLNHQKAPAHELLMKLQCQPFTSNFILNALIGEFTNIDSIYQLYKPIIWMAIQVLQTEPALDKLSTADNPWAKRSLPPILGDILQWLTGTTTIKDLTEIKQQINLVKQEQTK